MNHSAIKEKDSDELGGAVNSDSEASDGEGPQPGPTSAKSTNSPWEQVALDDSLRGGAGGTRIRGAGRRGAENTMRMGRNTGAKAVLRDKKAHDAREADGRERARLQREAVVHRAAYGVVASGPSVSAAAQAEERRAAAKARDGGADESDESDFEGSDEDDAFMAQYRASRISQLQVSAARPQFGELREVDQFQMLDELEGGDAEKVVVVHLYEEHHAGCRKLNGVLEGLARRMQSLQFLRLRATLAQKDFDPVALPTLMVYRGGELVESLLRVTDEMGGERADFGMDDVEWLLREKGGVGEDESAIYRGAKAATAADESTVDNIDLASLAMAAEQGWALDEPLVLAQ